jgi:hypothetical protein
VTLDGIGIAKPSTTRAAAVRSRNWWSRRLRTNLDVVRIKGLPA